MVLAIHHPNLQLIIVFAFILTPAIKTDYGLSAQFQEMDYKDRPCNDGVV